MASKGRWSPPMKNWERIYWKRTLPREQMALSFWPSLPSTDNQQAEWDAASARAKERAMAVESRRQRFQRYLRRKASA